MITPELIGYIRGEFAKGRTRDEIHAGLVADGGWSEADLNEAFRVVIPMQGFAAGSSASKKIKLSRQNLAFIIIGLLCVIIWWFYHPPIISFWNSSVDKLAGLSFPSFGAKKANNPENTVPSDTEVIINTVKEKDCGIGTAPDLKNPSTYENDAVLTCLGNSAFRCEDAKAVLKNDLFPTIFQIIKNQDSCNFQLSYGPDSTLIDITGQKLASQYILCPLGIVKAIDENNSQFTIFKAPSVENLSKYASQIYFYGILGVFMENNVEKNKIQALGCSGEYLDSVIASYQKIRFQQ